MDPQSQSFTPYSSNNDTWRLQTDVVRVQQIQAEHAERIARLERRQDDDARMKSVWGPQSPFPSVLSGTPQQAPLQQPPADQFRGFDDEANNLMSSLHLDAEEEPRRGMGATSRANSVRFDESANQNHFSHSTRPSVDFLSRTSSGLGGLQMTERTSSHKSDGRASSVHSMRSAASGRASSLNLDTGYGLGDANRSPLDTPGLAPGLLLLGSVPAIIRCWMNTNFKHDALLYAAVSTGSYKSFLDVRLIQKLGFEEHIKPEEDGVRTVELPVYFPEAVPHPASSRSSSPAPQLPTLTVNFQVVETALGTESKAIQIFLGSDTLRAHSADILFSSNSMTLLDDERSKLSIPLVRPENEATFNSLHTTSSAPQTAVPAAKAAEQVKERPPFLNGLGRESPGASISSATASPPPGLGKYRPPGVLAAETHLAYPAKAGATGSGSDSRPASRASSMSRPSSTLPKTSAEPSEQQSADSAGQSGMPRPGGGSAIWGNWRQGSIALPSSTPQPAGLDWANAGKNREISYQRKDTGIKVLKPKSASRTVSTSSTAASAAPSPADGKSRFFDEGRRRSGVDDPTAKPAQGELKKENQSTSTNAAAPKTKANPIGGASAFSWLNSGGGK
ncbi:UCH-domain-containing protein [Hortaea werneckii]|nr:UCH-domain-containing protein [Hortaea werneckii]KAI7055563.1 UCH-domain-containing protein [Hortaea werneckii]